MAFEETLAASLFQSIYDAFRSAKQLSGDRDQTGFRYKLAWQLIELHFANSTLVCSLTPALSHLTTSSTEPSALNIYIWDSSTTGVPLPSIPWSEGSYMTAQGEFSFQEGRVHYRDGRFELYYFAGTNLIFLDEKERRAIVWMQDAAALEMHETAAPLRTLLQWWLSRNGCQLVHAAAVGLEAGGVLIAAKGGSGKSTSALACLNSELRFVGDDYVAVTDKPEAYVYSLFSSAKIHADNLHRITYLRETIQNYDRLGDEKALLFLNDNFSKQIIQGFPLRALFIPLIVSRRHTTLTPVSSIAGLRALAPTTMFQLPGVDRKAFQLMAQLVRRLPCYCLELGSDITQVPAVILRFLRTTDVSR